MDIVAVQSHLEESRTKSRLPFGSIPSSWVHTFPGFLILQDTYKLTSSPSARRWRKASLRLPGALYCSLRCLSIPCASRTRKIEGSLRDDTVRGFGAAAAYSCAFGMPESGSLSFVLFAHHVPAREQLPPAMKTTKMMIAIKPSMTYLPSTATVPTEIL